MTETRLTLQRGYAALSNHLLQGTLAAQIRTAVTVDRELGLQFWCIGRDRIVRQKGQAWRDEVIDGLAAHLQRTFAEVIGFTTQLEVPPCLR